MLHDTLDSLGAMTDTAPATLHDLMAAVGYLLLQWGQLNTSLDEEIGQLRCAAGDTVGAPGRARTVNERLAEWRALLARGRRRHAGHDAAVDRVAISIQAFQRCQAMIGSGFVAAPAGTQPAIRCTQPSSRHSAGEGACMTLDEIRSTVEGMELCRSEMAFLRDLREH